MTVRLSMNLFAGLAVLAMTGIVSNATADDGCNSPYVWGRSSYFGDRWEYSHRHAYPEHTYRSSRHFIYYRRVPHFYSSSYRYNSNFYCSPEYRAYYTYGPYLEPSRYYDAHRYTSPATRPFVPYCEDDENIGVDYPPYYDYERRRLDDDSAPDDRDTINQRGPTDDARDRAALYLSRAGDAAMERGWDLLRDGKAANAMPVFAEAAMLRQIDALPRLAYGLAAAIDGQDMVAAWAIRKAIGAESDILTRVPVDPALKQQIVDASNGRNSDNDASSQDAADANSSRSERRDALVARAILAVLAEDAGAMKSALSELAKSDDQAIARDVAVASKAFVAARWTDDAADDDNEALASNDH